MPFFSILVPTNQNNFKLNIIFVKWFSNNVGIGKSSPIPINKSWENNICYILCNFVDIFRIIILNNSVRTKLKIIIYNIKFISTIHIFVNIKMSVSTHPNV